MRYAWAELEAMVRELVDSVGSRGIEAIAAACGVSIAGAALPRSVPALYVAPSRLVLVSPHTRGVERVAAVAHELGHAIAPSDATHADVWALTLVLLYPPQVVVERLVSGGSPLTAQSLWGGDAPRWAAVLRARYHLGARVRVA